MEISYDRYSMVLDGKRTVIRSGAMHYFRLPHPDLWRDRLTKLKALGYNTVDLYFCWDYHSPEPDMFDFKGQWGERDIALLLKHVEEAGLYLIARPGPYINAEYTGGGLPGWLLAKKDVTLRHRTEEGAFQWCDKYMAHVEAWWGALLPMVNACPNLIALQIENEYATQEVEPDSIRAHYDLARRLGVTVPLFHNDLYAAGLYEDVVDLYAFDNYSVTSFDSNWRTGAEAVLSMLDGVEENLRPFCQNRPLFVAELQAGWYATWQGHPYNHITNHLGREHIALTTKTLLGQGLTMFNHYKAIGGTNWSTIGSTDTYTSYDFGAPITEAGTLRESAYAAKAINLLLESFPLAATDPVGPPDGLLSDSPYLYRMRSVVGSPHQRWVFLRNLNDTSATFTVEGCLVTLHPHECLILPQQIPLASGQVIHSATLEPLYQNERVLLVRADRPGCLCLNEDSLGHVDSRIVASLEGEKRLLTVDTLPEVDCAVAQLGPLTVVFLGAALADRTWVEPSGRIVVGPHSFHGERLYGFAAETPLVVIETDGSITQLSVGETEQTSYVPPALVDWQLEHAAPALTENHEFFAVDAAGADFDNNGFYEGCAWYRYHLKGLAHTITVDARHIWAVLVNGTPIGQGHHFLTAPGQVPPQPTTLSIPPDLLHVDATNEVVVFVDGLGHPKGFHDDAAVSQGLLTFEVDGVNRIDKLLYSQGIQRFLKDAHPPAHTPVVWATTTFLYEPPSHIDCPLGLCLNLPEVERVNILLNGVLVGRHWRACQQQGRYVLPKGLLKPGRNTLVLQLIHFDPVFDLNHFQLQPFQATLQPYALTALRRV